MFAAWFALACFTPTALEYELVDTASSLPDISLFFNQRVTFAFPEPVVKAIPGDNDILNTHVKDKFVVVNLIDSEFVRAEQPTTNLSVILSDGRAVTCHIQVASSLEDANYELINISYPQTKELEPPIEPTCETSVIDDKFFNQIAKFGISEIKLKSTRTRNLSIYFTLTESYHLGEWSLLRIELRNRRSTPYLPKELVLKDAQNQLTPLYHSDFSQIPPDGAANLVAAFSRSEFEKLSEITLELKGVNPADSQSESESLTIKIR